jgi:hypothetical protein
LPRQARANFTVAVLTDPNDIADAQRLGQLDIQDAAVENRSAAPHKR